MKPIATDIYTFSELIARGVVYVDKTDLLHDLIVGSSKQFFLARPRRFGKSLTVSTLQAIFEGRRRLFAGLAIEPAWDWTKTWPVLRLDMGSCQAASAEALAQIKEKRYHEKYLASGKRITLVGMNFSSEKRAVDDWTSEVVD